MRVSCLRVCLSVCVCPLLCVWRVRVASLSHLTLERSYQGIPLSQVATTIALQRTNFSTKPWKDRASCDGLGSLRYGVLSILRCELGRHAQPSNRLDDRRPKDRRDNAHGSRGCHLYEQMGTCRELRERVEHTQPPPFRQGGGKAPPRNLGPILQFARRLCRK